MKKIFSIYNSFFVLIIGFLGTLSACHYDELLDEVDYSEQAIYMPASLYGIYDITESDNTYAVPTEGSPSRYTVDNDKLNIPLGVYRSGADSKGTVSVDITLKNDTISNLISTGVLTSTELLPEAKMSLPSSVEISKGEDISMFNLSVDLSFIKANPDKQYAVGVEISSSDREVNQELTTTIVLIKTSSLEF